MKQDALNEMMMNDGSYTALLNSIMVAARRSDSKLTPEELADREKRMKQREEQRILHYKVLKNICPSCDGKLFRGKKDKKRDYKRTWSCKDCESKYWV